MKQPHSKKLIILTVILLDLLVGMEFDLFIPSFPELQAYFHLTPFLVETLLSINFLGLCLSLFFVGALSDRFGRRPVLFLGLSIFIIGSLLCLFANQYFLIFIGRFLQGMGIAAPMILSFLLIADWYPLKKQQQLMGILNGSMNTAAALAPIIGSYITLHFQWHGNFLALLFLGLFALILAVIFVPNKLPLDHYEQTSTQYGYGKLIHSKPLLLLIFHLIIMFTPYWVFVGISPLLYMKDLGVTLSYFGYYQGILALAFALGSIYFGLIVNKCDQLKMLFISNFIFIISFLMMLYLTMINTTSPLLITSAVLCFTIGQIIPTTILYPICLNFIPEAKGRISALLSAARLIFSALFLQLAGYSYHGSFQHLGIILTGFFLLTIVSLFIVMRNKALMKAIV